MKRITLASFVLALELSISGSAQAQQVPPPRSAADVAGTPAGTVMTRAYVEMVGRMAYIWGWPLVNHFNRAAAFAKLPEPGRIGGTLPAAPTGYIGMLTDYIDEKRAVRYLPEPGHRLWRRIPAFRLQAGRRSGAGFRRPLLDLPDRGWANRFVLLHGEAVQHEARILFARWAELEGGHSAGCDRCLPIIYEPRRDLPACLPGRHAAGQGSHPAAAPSDHGLSALGVRRHNEDQGLDEDSVVSGAAVQRRDQMGHPGEVLRRVAAGDEG